MEKHRLILVKIVMGIVLPVRVLIMIIAFNALYHFTEMNYIVYQLVLMGIIKLCYSILLYFNNFIYYY